MSRPALGPASAGPTRAELSSGQLLAKNTILNLLGNVLPVIVSLVSVRLLVEGLGTERFGLLNLAWIVIGYFSLFDLGLGRALTKLVAEKLDTDQVGEIPRLFGTTMVLMLGIGVLGALVAAAGTPWFVSTALRLEGELAADATASFLLLAAATPLVIVTAGLRGYLEALQRFDLITAVRVPMSMFSYIGPLPVLLFTQSLTPVVAVLVVGRLVGTLIHLALCFSVSPQLRQPWRPSAAEVRALFSFGGWLTVSAIIGPFMVYMDRFLVGSYLSVSAVAYYATPYELVSRFSLVSGALAGVLFPAFAANYGHDMPQTRQLYDRGVKYLAYALLPVALGCVAFAPEGLLIWLGPEFAENSAVVLQMLSVGMWLNNLALLPFSLIQAAGRPALAAKIHLIELPCYLVLLLWLTSSYGILGVAAAWLIRATLDAAIMFVVGRHLLGQPLRSLAHLGLAVGGAVLLFVVLAQPFALGVRIALYLLAVGAVALVVWTRALAADERAWVRGRLSRFSRATPLP